MTSKTGAGEYALEAFGEEWVPIVTEALRLRRGEGEQTEDRRRPSPAAAMRSASWTTSWPTPPPASRPPDPAGRSELPGAPG